MTGRLFLFIISITFCSSCKKEITIITAREACNVESFAAGELSRYLSAIYPGYKFPVSCEAGSRKTISLNFTDSIPGVPDNEEGYLIKSDSDHAFIISKGKIGLIYGVYGILEKLGCGFYLSDEMLPEPRKDFDFKAWDDSDEPLVRERFVFNWHNFISGCTGWDKKHWMDWIDKSQKMGYNTIMIHTYHNNPMHTYEFNGIEKEVGYICTSAKGRDWGNIPVNDVRRLPGGEIFSNAEFGSEIAMVHDEQRVRIAQETMASVFAYAQKRGVKVNFAFDIDMPISYLQNTMIASIPKEEKFYLHHSKIWLPRPDKPDGLRFYQSQIAGLLNKYKTLSGITFFRRGSSYFKDIELNELPQEWQVEYHSFLKQNPYLLKLENREVIGSFVTAKLVRAYKRILEDMGRADISLGTGSWQHEFVVPTAAFLPESISLMPIDWKSRFNQSIMDDDDILHDFASPACAQRVVPFIWAHHDDGRYLGRPFRPTEDLYSKLKQADCQSFGVFHWMNRPLDLFFKSMSRQVWSSTKNESLEETCRFMALHYFGSENMAIYFMDWMSNAPMFGRATLMNFFYRKMDDGVFDFEEAIAGCIRRISLLDGADTSRMTAQQKGYIAYYKTLEQFIIDFSKTQPHLLNAEKLLDNGDIEGARRELKGEDPTACIKTFSKLSQVVKKERGEMAFTYRLATKYIPDYISFEQRTRLKPYYVNIDSVIYEDLAQGNRENFTYHIDPEGNFWECLGHKEFDSQIVGLSKESKLNEEISPFAEVFQFGLKIDTMNTIPIQPLMRALAVKNKHDVWKGKYELKVFAASENEEEVTFSVDVNGEKNTFTIQGKSIVKTAIEQKETGLLSLIIEPLKGDVIVCGVMMDPV